MAKPNEPELNRELLENEIFRIIPFTYPKTAKQFLSDTKLSDLKIIYNRHCKRTKSEHYAIRNGRTNE